MNNEQVLKEIAAIQLLAETQALLVTSAGASVAHTEMVLKDIVERCRAIKPATWSHDPAQALDDELVAFLEGTIGFVDASNEEVHGIWERYVHNASEPLTWQQKPGLGIAVGAIDDLPVFVSLSPVIVKDQKIIFYEATSRAVDHEMVRQFINGIAPESAKNGDRLNHTDATNFFNIFHNWKGAGT